MSVVQRTVKEELKRRITWVSYTLGVAHQYVSYDKTSDSFFEDPQLRRKESRLAVRGRIGASGKYLGGFGFAPGHGFGERFGGNWLVVRVPLHYLRRQLKVEALLRFSTKRKSETESPSESCCSMQAMLRSAFATI